jgi:hypothetical protein
MLWPRRGRAPRLSRHPRIRDIAGRWAIVSLEVATLASASLFLPAERRAAAPLVDLRLLIGKRLLARNVATTKDSSGPPLVSS